MVAWLWLTVAWTATYWILFFTTTVVQTSSDTAYLDFERAFPAADAWLAFASAWCAINCARRRPQAVLWALVPTKNSESVEKSGDLFRAAVVSPACNLCSRNSSHGSPVGFAAVPNWSLRSLRSGINSPSCAASVPDAASFSRSIA
ncbi:MAG: hypothetical protein WAN07_17225 [Candidatus Binatus sp.]